MVGGKKNHTSCSTSAFKSRNVVLNQSTREGCFEIFYKRKKLTYNEATQPSKSSSQLRMCKPPGFATQPPAGYGLYTDFNSGSMILNVSSIVSTLNLYTSILVLKMCSIISW